MADKWSDEEVHFLIKSRGKLTSAQIAQKLGRTTDAVSGKIKALKSLPRLVDEWTPDQDEFLQSMYPHFEAPILAEILGRTSDAVIIHAAKLGLSGKPKSSALQFVIWDAMKGGEWMSARDVSLASGANEDYSKSMCNKWLKSGHIDARRFIRTEGRGNRFVRQYRRMSDSAYFPPGVARNGKPSGGR